MGFLRLAFPIPTEHKDTRGLLDQPRPQRLRGVEERFHHAERQPLAHYGMGHREQQVPVARDLLDRPRRDRALAAPAHPHIARPIRHRDRHPVVGAIVVGHSALYGVASVDGYSCGSQVTYVVDVGGYKVGSGAATAPVVGVGFLG